MHNYYKGVVAAAMMAPALVLAAQPSAILGQELAATAAKGSVNVDFYNVIPNISNANSAAYGGGNNHPALRVGALDGEVFVTNQVHSDSYQIGYKRVLSQGPQGRQKGAAPVNVALYGGLGVDTPPNPSTNDKTVLTLGAAIDYRATPWLLNMNPRIEDDGTDSWTDIVLGAFYTVANSGASKALLLGAEVDLAVDTPAGIKKENISRLGVRWVPTDNVTFDFVVYDSSSGLQVPGLMRVNIGF
ncbi:MAG: hypothetical protein HY940_04920 [Gammaproteobacteria bacterium]|nr:hypothetical protein [Gammaproteobacteria bacterium]